jgi:hypothetical protein
MLGRKLRVAVIRFGADDVSAAARQMSGRA